MLPTIEETNELLQRLDREHSEAYHAYWNQRLEDGKAWASRRNVLRRDHGSALMQRPTPTDAERALSAVRKENREKRRALDQQRDADIAKARAVHAEKLSALNAQERSARDALREARERARDAEQDHNVKLHAKYGAERGGYYKASEELRPRQEQAREALQEARRLRAAAGPVQP